MTARKRKPQLPNISVEFNRGLMRCTIRANRALQRHLKNECETWRERDSTLIELLTSHGYFCSDGDSVNIGLTSAPFASDQWPDGNNELPEGAIVCAYGDYQINDWTEALRDDGEVTFSWSFRVEYEASPT